MAYDPQLPYLFYGEEVLMAVRCYTAGWDLYCPSRAWAFHLWEKEYRPNYDSRLGPDEQLQLLRSRARVAQLLGQPVEHSYASVAYAAQSGGGTLWPRPNGSAAVEGSNAAFGLGVVRSLEQYEAAAGVCFRHLEMEDIARRGYLDESELASIDDMDQADVHTQLAALTLSQPLAVGSATKEASSALAKLGAGVSLSELLGPPAGSEECRADGLRIVSNALPTSLAREARSFLAALPLESWDVADTPNQPLNGGARSVDMHYRRNPKADPTAMAALRERIRDALLGVVEARPFESLLLNFSRYDHGDFLDSHGDTPSGSKCYERRLAFVWHLSEGWSKKDGGLFVDEEADPAAPDGERHLAPTFNTLVTFAVPRMHRVTRVTAKGKPRFAVYGWVAAPELERPMDAKALRAVLARKETRAAGGENGISRATAVLMLPTQPGPIAAQAMLSFAALPMTEVGLGHQLGDYCRFVVAPSDEASRAVLQLDRKHPYAKAAGDDAEGACCLCVLPPGADAADAAVLSGARALQEPAALREFLDAERKVWAPCSELDLREPLVMSEMFFSQELKLFVFAPYAQRPKALLEKLDRWARFLKPHIRIYLAEPSLCEAVMAEFGLRGSDAPTAVAYDTAAARQGVLECRWRMVDLYAGKPPPKGEVDVGMLTKFTILIAKRTKLGVESSQLALT